MHQQHMLRSISGNPTHQMGRVHLSFSNMEKPQLVLPVELSCACSKGQLDQVLMSGNSPRHQHLLHLESEVRLLFPSHVIKKSSLVSIRFNHNTQINKEWTRQIFVQHNHQPTYVAMCFLALLKALRNIKNLILDFKEQPFIALYCHQIPNFMSDCLSAGEINSEKIKQKNLKLLTLATLGLFSDFSFIFIILIVFILFSSLLKFSGGET